MTIDPTTLIEDLREELAELGSTTGLADIPGVWSYDKDDGVWNVKHAGGHGYVDVIKHRSIPRAAGAYPVRREDAAQSGRVNELGYVRHLGGIRETCAVVASILEDFAAKESA